MDFAHGGTWTNAGENISHGRLNIYDQFDGWKNSPNHYNIMTKKDKVYFGYAVYADITSDYLIYGVQLFWTDDARDQYM